jgi:hypothetical protein
MGSDMPTAGSALHTTDVLFPPVQIIAHVVRAPAGSRSASIMIEALIL